MSEAWIEPVFDWLGFDLRPAHSTAVNHEVTSARTEVILRRRNRNASVGSNCHPFYNCQLYYRGGPWDIKNPAKLG